MAYVGTRFDIIDETSIPNIESTSTIVKPSFMIVSSADKGTEKWTEWTDSKAWFKQYGTDISFKKHGQPLLEAANIISSGGKLFFKRVVAEDATLANIAIFADVSKTSVAKTNTQGQPLYTDAQGHETTVAEGNTAVMVDTATIKYSAKSLANNKDINTIYPLIEAEASASSFPLFLITDNGRGESNKKIRVYASYSLSKRSEFTKYVLEVFDGDTTYDTIYFSMNPDQIEYNISQALDSQVKSNATQIDCKIFEEQIGKFYDKVAESSGISLEQLQIDDVLFGCNKKGVSVSGIKVDATGLDMTSVFGTSLTNGTNGTFGTTPITATTYEAQVVKAFDGTFDDAIYDLDNHVIDIVPDANYSAPIKRAIEGFVSFREDCMYFRDLGIGLQTIDEIKAADENSTRNKFCASYENSYDIKDPYTKKQITVTIMYDLAAKLVDHFNNGRVRPVAGILYGFTFPNIIEGTLNFCPKITPSVNQKEELEDLRINYGSYYEGLFTLETEYTSQEEYTQFSFVNNILAVQEVIKAIRSACPKMRYTFLDGDDLTKYQNDVENVLTNYRANFKTLTLEYGNDAAYEANKIYYALLKVSFRDFVQSEYFKVIAINSSSSTN